MLLDYRSHHPLCRLMGVVVHNYWKGPRIGYPLNKPFQSIVKVSLQSESKYCNKRTELESIYLVSFIQNFVCVSCGEIFKNCAPHWEVYTSTYVLQKSITSFYFICRPRLTGASKEKSRADNFKHCESKLFFTFQKGLLSERWGGLILRIYPIIVQAPPHPSHHHFHHSIRHNNMYMLRSICKWVLPQNQHFALCASNFKTEKVHRGTTFRVALYW